MKKALSLGNRNFLLILLASIVLLVTSCGQSDNQQSSGFGAAGEEAGSGLAVDAFVFVASQALEQSCSNGDKSACKIAFAVDPDFKSQWTQEQINNKLDSMNDNLSAIEHKLSEIEVLLKSLSDQLTIAVDDLKFEYAKGTAIGYMRPVQSAYKHLFDTNFSDPTVNPLPFVSSYLTSIPSSNPWDVPGNLDQLHELIVDESDQGLFTKMGKLLSDKWKKGPPSYNDAISTYELMEQYFGYLLTQQSKGLMVIAASYNYLSIYPDATISSHILYGNFDAYLKNEYRPHVEKQIQVFLQHVQSYIASVADVDKPAAGASKDGIQDWTSVVLRRADLMAAWARASLNTVSGTTPALLVVRVIGEPERSKLLYNKGTSTIFDANTGTQYVFDKTDPMPDPDSEDEAKDNVYYRQWTTPSPYIQFPLHPELAKGTVERDGAIMGANSFIMSKYILTGSDLQSPVQEGVRTLKLPEWIGYAETSVKLVGPDGNAPVAGGPSMYYGHTTIVLKETAAHLGIWSHGTSAEVHSKSTDVDNLKHSVPHAQDSFPQSLQLYLHADPKRSSKTEFDPSGGGAWTEYSINGHAYYYAALQGQYYFEGWGDVPEKNTLRVRPILSGTSGYEVKLPASNGSNSMELYFTMEYLKQWVEAKPHTKAGNVSMSLVAHEKWAPKSPVRFFIEPRIECDWNTQRADISYKTCTFEGTNKFDLKSLVLHVNE